MQNFQACNELRQSRAMMSQDSKSNSSLDAQKSSSYNRLSKKLFRHEILQKIWQLFGQKEPKHFQLHHFWGISPNFFIFS